MPSKELRIPQFIYKDIKNIKTIDNNIRFFL